MNIGTSGSERRGTVGAVPRRALKRFLALAILLGIAIALMLVWARRRNVNRTSETSPRAGSEAAVANPLAVNAEDLPAALVRPKEMAVGLVAAVAATEALDPTEQARSLIERLSRLQAPVGPVTAESITECRQNLLALQELNVAAIPALEEYFRRDENVVFEGGPGTNLLDAPTLRIAFMKMLFDFTAPDNELFQAKMLQTVSDPEEVSVLARQLEIAVPGQYRDVILDAIKASVDMAREGRFPGRDVGPLLKLLEKYEGSKTPDTGR